MCTENRKTGFIDIWGGPNTLSNHQRPASSCGLAKIVYPALFCDSVHFGWFQPSDFDGSIIVIISLITLPWEKQTKRSCNSDQTWVGLAEELIEQMLWPDDAVDGLWGRVANGTSREGLLVGFGMAVVALCGLLFDDRHLTQVSGSSGLNKGHVGSQAHPIDVGACGPVSKKSVFISISWGEAQTATRLVLKTTHFLPLKY